jgi:hypothetical protein
LHDPPPSPQFEVTNSVPIPGSFQTRYDNVHLSSTSPYPASGHGWWQIIEGPATRAKVTIQLQARRYPYTGSWTNVGVPGSKTVYSGGGSANRAAANAACKNRIESVQWRSVVDVDLIGYADPPDKSVSTPQLLWCGF